MASASDPFGVTKVPFVLSGNDQRSTIISEGVKTSYGWIGAWDSRTVPDGDYLPQHCVLTRRAEANESFIDVRVAN